MQGHAQHGGGELGNQLAVAFDLGEHSFGECFAVGVGGFFCYQFEGPGGINLFGVEHPHVGAANVAVNGVVESFHPAVGLVALLLGQVELFCAVLYHFPPQVVAGGVFEAFQLVGVGNQEDQRVAVGSLCRAFGFHRGANPLDYLGFRPVFLATPQPGMHDHEPNSVHVGNVGGSIGRNMDVAEEAPSFALRGLQPADDFVPCGVRVFPQLFRMVARGFRHRRLGVEPVQALLFVEVGGSLGNLFDRGAEVAERVARNCGAQPQILLVQSLVGGFAARCRPDEDGAGDALRDRPFSQCGAVRVDTLRGGADTINVGVDDGFPLVFQVLGEVGIHPGGGQRHVAGQDQRRRIVVVDPEFVHDGGHELEHATGALESLQGGPVLIEPIQ